MDTDPASTRPLDIYIGKRVRHYRTAKRQSMAALARAVGVTHRQIAKYELGTNRISATMLFMLSQALGRPPGDFLPPSDGSADRELARSPIDPVAASDEEPGLASDGSKLRRLVQMQVERVVSAIAAGFGKPAAAGA